MMIIQPDIWPEAGYPVRPDIWYPQKWLGIRRPYIRPLSIRCSPSIKHFFKILSYLHWLVDFFQVTGFVELWQIFSNARLVIVNISCQKQWQLIQTWYLHSRIMKQWIQGVISTCWPLVTSEFWLLYFYPCFVIYIIIICKSIMVNLNYFH